VLTFETPFARRIGEARFQGPIVTTFAVLGALLAAIGVFRIVSFLMSQRTREFGIRVALGARRSDVGLTVIRESLIPALVGVAAGSLGAWRSRKLCSRRCSAGRPVASRRWPSLLPGC
jgi:ABC-type antimicrobial peptide transport system permease subunit